MEVMLRGFWGGFMVDKVEGDGDGMEGNGFDG